MISARWPNARREDGTTFNQPASWAHQAEGSEYGSMINDPAYQDLASENRDFTGAIAILNIGSWATYTSRLPGMKKAATDLSTIPTWKKGWKTLHSGQAT